MNAIENELRSAMDRLTELNPREYRFANACLSSELERVHYSVTIGSVTGYGANFTDALEKLEVNRVDEIAALQRKAARLGLAVVPASEL